ncbi:hypothetical protein [Streptomyces sp. NPDC002602]|uniref:hypothetical protein n=1 Tax=Streptomyces sp. NPDC002602 TaxID=3364654 RepID=UPI003692CDF2
MVQLKAACKRSGITRRWVKNDRLNHAGYLWAFSSLRSSPGSTHRRRRDFNHMIGQLYHCLQQSQRYDEALALPAPPVEVVTAAE